MINLPLKLVMSYHTYKMWTKQDLPSPLFFLCCFGCSWPLQNLKGVTSDCHLSLMLSFPTNPVYPCWMCSISDLHKTGLTWVLTSWMQSQGFERCCLDKFWQDWRLLLLKKEILYHVLLVFQTFACGLLTEQSFWVKWSYSRHVKSSRCGDYRSGLFLVSG